MSSLTERLRKVSDRLGALHTKLGDPRYIQVVMLDPSGGAILIEPNPMVIEVSPGKIAKYLSANVEINLDDLEVSPISRRYPDDVVAKSRYLLNAYQEADGRWQGQRAEVLHVDRSEMLAYKVILRKYRSR